MQKELMIEVQILDEAVSVLHHAHTFGLVWFGWILWHCKLFNAKSIYIYIYININSSFSNNSV